MSRSLFALLLMLGYLCSLHPAATAQEEGQSAKKKRNAAVKKVRQQEDDDDDQEEEFEEEMEELEEELEEELQALEARLEKWANSHAREWEQWAGQMERQMESWARKTEEHMEELAEQYAHKFESWARDFEAEFKPEQMQQLLQQHLMQLKEIPLESLHVELSRLGKDMDLPLEELNRLNEHVAGALEKSLAQLERRQHEGDLVGQSSEDTQKLKVALEKMENALAVQAKEMALAAKMEAAKAAAMMKKVDHEGIAAVESRAPELARALREKAEQQQAKSRIVARQAMDKLMAARDAKAADLRDMVAKLKKIRDAEKDVPAELVRAIEASEAQLHELESQLHRMGDHFKQLDRQQDDKESHLRALAEKERRAAEENRARDLHREKVDMERLHAELQVRNRRIEEKEDQIQAMRHELEALRRELNELRRKDR